MDSVGCGGAPDAAAFGDDRGQYAGPYRAGLRWRTGRGGAVGPVADAESGPAGAGGGGPAGLGRGDAGAGGGAAGALGGGDGGVARQGHAFGPLGTGRGAGAVGLDLFPDDRAAFPADIVAEVCRLAGTDGILGNCHASGVPIIAAHCEEHLRTGWPICYTSADSVFQIAAHEEAFGLDRLLKLCADLAPMLHACKVGRVIARPFTGSLRRLQAHRNRQDFAIAPPAPTLLDWVQGAGRATHAVGKIGDIFSMRGIGHLHKGKVRC